MGIGALWWLALATTGIAQDSKTEPEPEIGTTGKAKKAASQMRLMSLVPLNTPIHDFRLPQYDEKAQLVSLIEVRRLRRVSEKRFALEDVRIRLYENGEVARQITTPHARFHVAQQLLAGDHLVKVERPGESEPEATGRGFVYDMNSRIWSLLSENRTMFRFKKADSSQIDEEKKPSEKP